MNGVEIVFAIVVIGVLFAIARGDRELTSLSIVAHATEESRRMQSVNNQQPSVNVALDIYHAWREQFGDTVRMDYALRLVRVKGWPFMTIGATHIITCDMPHLRLCIPDNVPST